MNDLKEIWLTFSGRFYRIAYYILDSQEDAEDAVQELYLKLWSARSSLENVKTPMAYGMSMLKNICIDKIRKRTVRNSEPLETAPPMTAPSAHGHAEIRDTLRYLLNEMEKLPQKQREVLKMRTMDGMEYEEISKRTGLSQVHIRVLVATARKTLKKKL